MYKRYRVTTTPAFRSELNMAKNHLSARQGKWLTNQLRNILNLLYAQQNIKYFILDEGYSLSHRKSMLNKDTVEQFLTMFKLHNQLDGIDENSSIHIFSQVAKQMTDTDKVSCYQYDAMVIDPHMHDEYDLTVSIIDGRVALSESFTPVQFKM